MYRVLGRERISGGRFGRYIVEFSHPWPEEASYLYLVSSFTSFFPGRVELLREGDRGRAVVLLWEGSYPYRFASTCGLSLLDSENPERALLVVWPDSGAEEEYSVAKVGVEEHRRAVEEGSLKPELVVHDERDPSFVSRYLDYTVVRLKAPRGTVEEAFVEVEGSPRPRRMEKFHGNELVDYFQGVVRGAAGSYRFLLRAGGEEVYFGAEGLGDEGYIAPPRLVGPAEPHWFIGCVYYLVFPDSFVKSSRRPDGGRPRARLGGRLENIASALGHLKDLGVDALYLTPIYKSASYHGYDVIDHFTVDDSLGGWEGWHRLREEVERLGVKLVLDVVAHHVSPCSREFSSALLGGDKRYESWFRFQDGCCRDAVAEFIRGGCRSFPEELRGRRPFYETFMCSWGLAKLNYSNPEVLERLLDVASFWLENGASGLRIDVGHALPDSALQRLYERVKSARGDAVVILEVSRGVKFYPYGALADGAMNYDLRDLILDFLVRGRLSARGFVEGVKDLYVSVPLFAANAMYNLLGSHDTPRVATLAKSCGRKCLEAAYVLLFALPGSPSIYYGDEVGAEGGGDPDNRHPMPPEEEWDRRLLCLIRRLALLRKSLKPLRLGFFDAEAVGDNAVLVKREWEGEEVLILVNSRGSAEYRLQGEYKDVVEGETVEEVKLGDYDWRILRRREK